MYRISESSSNLIVLKPRSYWSKYPFQVIVFMATLAGGFFIFLLAGYGFLSHYHGLTAQLPFAAAEGYEMALLVVLWSGLVAFFLVFSGTFFFAWLQPDLIIDKSNTVVRLKNGRHSFAVPFQDIDGFDMAPAGEERWSLFLKKNDNSIWDMGFYPKEAALSMLEEINKVFDGSTATKRDISALNNLLSSKFSVVNRNTTLQLSWQGLQSPVLTLTLAVQLLALVTVAFSVAVEWTRLPSEIPLWVIGLHYFFLIVLFHFGLIVNFGRSYLLFDRDGQMDTYIKLWGVRFYRKRTKLTALESLVINIQLTANFRPNLEFRTLEQNKALNKQSSRDISGPVDLIQRSKKAATGVKGVTLPLSVLSPALCVQLEYWIQHEIKKHFDLDLQ